MHVCIHTLNIHRDKESPFLNCMGTREGSQVQEVSALSNLYSTRRRTLLIFCDPSMPDSPLPVQPSTYWMSCWALTQQPDLESCQGPSLAISLQGRLDCAREESTPSCHLDVCQGLPAATKYLLPCRRERPGDSWPFWAGLSCGQPL